MIKNLNDYSQYISNKENLSLTEEDLGFLKSYMDTQEKLKAFLATYMYILSPGTGDGIMESNRLESIDIKKVLEDNNELNENVLGNVMAFLKGKTGISKYYKGLDSAAKNYIKASKQIDKLDLDKRTDSREKALDVYTKQVKSLDSIKSDVDKLKKDSKILTKYDQFALNKYKINLFLSGKKSGVSLAKLKGYEDKIDKIKADQVKYAQEIKDNEQKTKKEQEKAKEKVAEEGDKKDDKDEKTEVEKTQSETAKIKADVDKENPNQDTKDVKNEKIQKQLDDLKAKKNRIKIESIKKPKKGKDYEKEIDDLSNKVANLEKKLKENSTLSLSFFYELSNINEKLTCLENSIGENL